jgi:hypothetical protein
MHRALLLCAKSRRACVTAQHDLVRAAAQVVVATNADHNDEARGKNDLAPRNEGRGGHEGTQPDGEPEWPLAEDDHHGERIASALREKQQCRFHAKAEVTPTSGKVVAKRIWRREVQVRPRTAIAVVGSAMMVGLLGASSAFAVKEKEPLHASFKLKGSHHYEISGLGFGNSNGTFLTASRGHGSAQYVGSAGPGEYAGSASAKRMALDLGSRGGYDLRFHRKKTKMIDPPKGCTGPQAKARIGVWKGRINFRAEGGYTSVHARRARGRVVLEHAAWRCPFVKGTELVAEGFSDHSVFPEFTAFKPDHASATRFAVLSAWDPVPAKGATVLARRHAAVHGTSGQFMFTPGLTGKVQQPCDSLICRNYP